MSAPQKDTEGFAVPPPPSKRQLRPTGSLPQTTTEIYGEKHGISPDLQAALANIGRRGRQTVQMGHATHRAFERTQSFPAHMMNTPMPGTGFHTELDAITHAQSIIHKEAMRAREVQPFYSSGSGSSSTLASTSDVDGLALSPRGRGRKLKFTPDGQVEEEMDGDELDQGYLAGARGAKRTDDPLGQLIAARKRRSSPAEGEVSDTETEVDEDEDVSAFGGSSGFGLGPSQGPGPGPGQAQAPPGGVFDFPPVFKSAAMTHPELFGPTGSTSRAFPSAFKGVNANPRELRGLPGARRTGFGKTMSAPVGRLGGWGGMDVDGDGGAQPGDAGDEEDGFSVKDWAESEQF
ncbi:hypothetical protein IAU60_002516 [Kwoniella sp. DSM 27419]